MILLGIIGVVPRSIRIRRRLGRLAMISPRLRHRLQRLNTVHRDRRHPAKLASDSLRAADARCRKSPGDHPPVACP